MNTGNRLRMPSNDIRAFIYQWFGWLDHRTEPNFFLEHLNNSSMYISIDDIQIHSHIDFIKWYEKYMESIQLNIFEVSELIINHLSNDSFNTTMIVHRDAVNKNGILLSTFERQEWKLSKKDGKMIVNQIIINTEPEAVGG